jgi:L-lactate utilization protein LutC
MEAKSNNTRPLSGTNNDTGISKKTLWILVLAAVVLLAGIWIWKEVQIKNIKKEAATDRQQLQNQAESLLVKTQADHLQLLAKPFIWAVRTEMLNKNISQVNQYANDLVKEKNFRSILITDEKGLIVSSTDKKLEGKEYITVGNQSYLSGNATQVNQINNQLIMSSPIMGFNSRLGTAIITYNLQQPDFR